MGGCCCSCRKPQLQGAPIFYYYPPALEENESLTSHDSASVNRANGYFIGLNLDASSPDTFRRPPTPIPFDVVLGYPPSTDSSSFDKGNYVKTKENVRAQAGSFPVSPKKLGVELCKLTEANASTTEEEDVCPTCFEEYHGENPKIITKCNHHYHLSCILEWIERSDTCPICNQEMDFEVL